MVWAQPLDECGEEVVESRGVVLTPLFHVEGVVFTSVPVDDRCDDDVPGGLDPAGEIVDGLRFWIFGCCLPTLAFLRRLNRLALEERDL